MVRTKCHRLFLSMFCGCSWSYYAPRSVPVSSYFVVFLSSHFLLAENSCFAVCCPVTTIRNRSTLRDWLSGNPNRRNRLKKNWTKRTLHFFFIIWKLLKVYVCPQKIQCCYLKQCKAQRIHLTWLMFCCMSIIPCKFDFNFKGKK